MKKKVWIGTLGGHLKSNENPSAVTVLSAKDFKRLMKFLERPGKPTVALRRLMKGH